MEVNPVLIEIVRGKMAESAHRGAVAVMGADGETRLALGDLERPVYPRSAVKALQALPLVESGAAEAFALSDEELAVACASHSGADYHIAAVRGLLRKAGLDERHLACGAHPPLDEEESHRAEAGGGARPVHNNCSGKHAGMLATCVHLGWPVKGYERPDHPLQLMILDRMSALTGEDLARSPGAIDGCSVPTWAVSLGGLARAFARFGTGAAMDAVQAGAARRLMEACFNAPEWVAGEGRLDTVLLRRLRGEAFVKTGAEGVYCAALPRLGFGLALKIDDGGKRAAEAALVHTLAALLPGRRAALGNLIEGKLRNWSGRLTGRIEAAPALTAGLEGAVHHARDHV